MIVADTSIWISFLRQDDQQTYEILKAYLRRDEVYSVTAIFGELYQGVKGKRERDIIDQIYENIPAVTEDHLFTEAGHISNHHKLYAKGVGLIDCYIIAACFSNGLSLWTHDKKLRSAYESMMANELD